MTVRRSPALTRREAVAVAAAACVWPVVGRAQIPAPAILPASADLSDWMTPVKDQGNRHTCAYFAVNAALEAALRKDRGITMSLSEEFLIYIAQRDGPRPVANETIDIQTPVDIACTTGSVPEADWPYQASPPDPLVACGATPCPRTDAPERLIEQAAKLKAGVRVLAGIHKGHWGRADMRDPASRVQICMDQLGRNRRAIIVAIREFPGHDEWRDDGQVLVTPRLRGLINANQDASPNHFVVLSGYDQRTERFFFKNSWGRSWGKDGYGWVSFRDLGTPLLDDVFVTMNFRQGT